MTETVTKHWLYEICGHHSFARNPWLITWQGRTWAVATDGVQLVLLQEIIEGVEVAPPETEKKMLNVLANQPETFTSIEWKKFRDWCGLAEDNLPCQKCTEGTTDCDDCCGSGRQTCPHCDQPMDCEACEGEGLIPCESCHGLRCQFNKPSKYGLLLGKGIDRNKIAKSIHRLEPCIAVDVGMRITDKCPCFYFRSAKWQLIVMGLKSGEWEKEKPEEFVP